MFKPQYIIPETFLTGNIEGIPGPLLVADAISVKAMCHAGADFPEGFFDNNNPKSMGFTMAKIAGVIGMDPWSDKAISWAMEQARNQ